jgi:cyclophilin family peptidyl-prolyl cis-trans isomerase
VVVTNYGKLEFEINCGKAPNSAEKFLELSKSNFYKNMSFEAKDSCLRSVSDPELKPDSYYSDSFKDPYTDKSLTHSQRGLLSVSYKD